MVLGTFLRLGTISVYSHSLERSKAIFSGDSQAEFGPIAARQNGKKQLSGARDVRAGRLMKQEPSARPGKRNPWEAANFHSCPKNRQQEYGQPEEICI
jgi:hypothetical protein